MKGKVHKSKMHLIILKEKIGSSSRLVKLVPQPRCLLVCLASAQLLGETQEEER